MLKRFALTFLLGILFLTACAPAEVSPTETEPELRFVPQVTMYEEGKVQFELGIANNASEEQPMIADANILATFTDNAGKIRNQFEIVDIGPIPGEQSKFPLTLEAVYDPGRYVVSLTGEGLPSLSFSFEIVEEDGIRKLAAPPEFINPHTEFTIDAPKTDS